MEDKMIILIGVIIGLILVIIGVYFLVRRKTISDALKEELKRDKRKNIRDQEVEEDEDEKDLKDISSILDNSNEVMKVEIEDEYEKETNPKKEQKTVSRTIIIKPSNKLTDTEAERIKLKIRRKHLFEEFKREEEKQKQEEKKQEEEEKKSKQQAESKIKSSLDKLRKISKKDTSIIELPNEPPADKKAQAIENLKKIHR